MNKVIFEMIAAGVLFGAWPLLMNRSGLNGMTASAAFVIVVFLIIMPVALKSGLAFSGSKWGYALAAGVCSACGLLILNDGLSLISTEEVAKMFIIMLVVQASVPAVYDIIVNQHFVLKSTAGFVFALLAVVCLV